MSAQKSKLGQDLVSVIVPVYNAEQWLDRCFQSILQQNYLRHCVEISIFDDASTDNSLLIIDKWKSRFEQEGFSVVFSRNLKPHLNKGCGYAKNCAVRQSSGSFLCFLDSDDVMLPERIETQLLAAKVHENCIVGCNFDRLP